MSDSMTIAGPAPKRKVYHRADKIGPNGQVSALCFKVPRAIDLSKALWTIRDEAVTCPRCRKRAAEDLSAARRAATAVDELAVVGLEWFDDQAHSGLGWYYWDRNYPDEGSVGPFETRAAALEHARTAGYAEPAP